MKTQTSGKWKEKSSLATRGRFFLFLILTVLWSPSLDAKIYNEHKDENTVSDDSLKLNANIPKIYVTEGAQISDAENLITSPIVIVKSNEKKETSKKSENKKLKSKQIEKKNFRRNTQNPVLASAYYYRNTQDKELGYFNVSSDKVLVAPHQIKLFSINTFFILSILLLLSLHLICSFKENTFFVSIIGKNFQRPPPYFSTQLFK